MKKKLLSMLVLLPMAVTQGAWAETIDLSTVTANTTAQNGDVLTGVLDGTTQKYQISIAAGATVTLDGVTINGVTDGAAEAASSAVNWAGLTCEGNATIVLKDGTTNTVRGFYHRCPGIFVPAGSTLTIEGPGTLNASASISTEANHVDKSSNQITCSPGIGSAVLAPAGNIVINGGTINATGGWASAAIGGNFTTACGNITINGGTVNASGSLSAAAIGGGWYATSGDIEITGGTVTAINSLSVNDFDGGPGIGSGALCAGGNITISGTAKVTAVGGYCAAGIGAGGTSSGVGSSCGTITIGGSAEVTATGGFAGAAIGGGAGIWAAATCGNITIAGGTINAVGGKAAAGIGGGWNMGWCSNIIITGGTIVATGGNNHNGEDGAPGIGGSPGGSCGDITISGANIIATKGDVAPCSIGKGGTYNAVPGTCGTITIDGTGYADGVTDSPSIFGKCGYCGDPSVNDGKNVIWSLNGGVMTISGTGAMEDYSGNTGQPWKDSRSSITSVVVQTGVTHIGNNSLSSFTNMTSVSLPEGLLTIGNSAFSGDNNTSFTEVTIPASVTSIGQQAFYQCNKLTSVTFSAGSNLTSIGIGAFANCSNLTTVTLNSNPFIGPNAFPGGATVTMNLTAHEGATGEYWMTFYNQNYSFEADANTQVFKAELSGTSITLHEVTDKIVTKGTAVVLKSTGNPVMTKTSSASDNSDTNSLEGVTSSSGMTAADPSTTYVLNSGTKGVGFYKLASGNTLEANKAYLTYSGSGAPSFFGFDDGETTGINAVNGEGVTVNGSVYDLQGRRVAQPTKGLYIVNGKKVIIK